MRRVLRHLPLAHAVQHPGRPPSRVRRLALVSGDHAMSTGAPPVSVADPSGAGFDLIAWLTTTDHKRIGVLYMVAAFTFFLFGGLLAMTMRAELALPGLQLFNEQTYDQAFTMHGTIMMLLFGTPMVAALANYLVPLQIGAADMVFPRLNALSFWLFLFGGLIVLSGYVAVGGPADVGWTGYPPNSELTFSTTTGTDLWIVGLALTGVASILGGLNFIATIYSRRAPGMSLLRMPLFCWTILTTSILILFAFPALTGALAMLLLDRRFGATFFVPAEGGDPVLWQHLFWFFGHPEVYILALPFFGMISEIIPVFARKPIFGYKAIAASTVAIAFLGLLVWAHHMFAEPTPTVVLAFFMLASFTIAVPTGIKIFNWLATLWRGQIVMKTPLYFAAALPALFTIGGISGVILAIFPVDWYLHDTYFVVAHFHFVLFGGSVFGLFGGLYYWFPKMSGRMMSEFLGKLSFWLMFVGFNTTFLVQHSMGLSGMPRRIYDYDEALGVDVYNLISTIGAFILGIGVLVTVVNVLWSIKNGRRAGNDPWQGNTLEWFTTSPPPPNNFDVVPRVRSVEPMKDIRREVAAAARPAETVAQPVAPRSL